MPQIRFEKDVVVPILYSQIKGVRVRPSETQETFRVIKVGSNIPGIVTDAVYHHRDGCKADLYLYAAPDETVALDLDGHSYRKVIFQIKREKAIDIAQRIQQEISNSQRSSDNLS
ncbi:hypothetical protein BCR33DRAFT_712843 [Rhizoclosmatium globosum]|uniref:Uncharacterized protein n=1 Tax=Rhizoclosmatium globosum TaxID=329046 RepID=A0A1Y2CUZ9_9FUNG|nr:hypothetical protein BCR33DRAFT_712843 [Rhizoclosmatium globosum]|eukprot:ORY50871.1 hypothetical protein BCR33DRAFT_712843 [Rhizoclosmatium globosum]